MRVRDQPAERARGQARRATREPAERLGVPVVDPHGQRVGEVTDAMAPLEENIPRVVIGLDEEVRRDLHLDTSAVDVESRYLTKDDDGTVRLTEPLREVLRHQGFDV